MDTSAKHYKRLRMQVDLWRPLSSPALPDGYQFVSWKPIVQERHAQVQWRSFRNDLDGQVFRCLGSLTGCRRLLHETVAHSQLAPESTWLIQFQPEPDWPPVDCAMIQGLIRPGSVGAIQNVGVVPEHRGFGLGRAILLKALHGFRLHGARYATLEVTADNRAAVGLYLSTGFEVTRVLYRSQTAGAVVSGSERRPHQTERRLIQADASDVPTAPVRGASTGP